MQFFSPWTAAFHLDREVAIPPEEFCELAVSHRPLVRVNDETVGMCGLLDRQTGELFFVPEVDLERWLNADRGWPTSDEQFVASWCG